jgi:hypothetical protein
MIETTKMPLAARARLVATPEHRLSRCKQRSNGISANSVVNLAPRRLRPSGSRAAGRLAVRRQAVRRAHNHKYYPPLTQHLRKPLHRLPAAAAAVAPPPVTTKL